MAIRGDPFRDTQISSWTTFFPMKCLHEICSFSRKNLLFASYNTCSVILYEARIKVSSLVIAISHELPPWITPNILLHIIHFRIILQYVWWLEKLNIGILPKFSTRWGPQHSIQLPYKWLNSVVYGRYNDNWLKVNITIIKYSEMGFINQQTSTNYIVFISSWGL